MTDKRGVHAGAVGLERKKLIMPTGSNISKQSLRPSGEGCPIKAACVGFRRPFRMNTDQNHAEPNAPIELVPTPFTSVSLREIYQPYSVGPG